MFAVTSISSSLPGSCFPVLNMTVPLIPKLQARADSQQQGLSIESLNENKLSPSDLKEDSSFCLWVSQATSSTLCSITTLI